MHGVPSLLEGPPKNWYRQLKTSTKATWRTLLAAFQTKFCGDAISLLHKYHEMRRMPTEDFVDYLYRLNAQVRRANREYESGKEGKEHVQHFLNLVQDRELVKTLTPLCIRDVETLKEVLTEMRRAEERKKFVPDEDPKAKASRRDSGKCAEPRSSRATSPDRSKRRIEALVPTKKPTRPDRRSSRSPITDRRGSRQQAASDQSESGGNGHKSDSSDSEIDSDSSEQSHRSSANERSPGSDEEEPTLSKAQRSQTKQILRMFAATNNSCDPVDLKEANVRNRDNRNDRDAQDGPCTHYGPRKHRDLDCWCRLTCEHCGRHDHPSDHCFRVCNGCGKVHDRGKCPLEEMVNRLRIWYKLSQHAGILPPDVEKWLNEIAC